MSNVVITPKKLHGSITLPPSKSLIIRAIICAAFANGTSVIKNVSFSSDIITAIEAVEALGAKVTREEKSVFIDGTRTLKNYDEHKIDFKSYESILRFLIPLSLKGEKVTFYSKDKKVDSNIEPYCEIFDDKKINYKINGEIKLNGDDISGIIKINNTVNSQFISGLLLALPLMRYDSIIQLNAPYKARGHIAITLDIMRKFGVNVINIGYHTFKIHGRQAYNPTEYYAEGDFAKAAYFIAAGALGNFVVCKDLPEVTNQPDCAILKIIESFGGKIVREKGNIAAIPSPLFGTNINISPNPSLLPIVALLATFADGETVINGIDSVEKKILKSVVEQMNSIGATIIDRQNSLIIEGSPSISGGTANCNGNFRLALSFAIASTRADDTVTIENIECISKYFPEFWDNFITLGGMAN